jgi:hypothetical protein
MALPGIVQPLPATSYDGIGGGIGLALVPALVAMADGGYGRWRWVCGRDNACVVSTLTFPDVAKTLHATSIRWWRHWRWRWWRWPMVVMGDDDGRAVETTHALSLHWRYPTLQKRCTQRPYDGVGIGIGDGVGVGIGGRWPMGVR